MWDSACEQLRGSGGWDEPFLQRTTSSVKQIPFSTLRAQQNIVAFHELIGFMKESITCSPVLPLSNDFENSSYAIFCQVLKFFLLFISSLVSVGPFRLAEVGWINYNTKRDSIVLL